MQMRKGTADRKKHSVQSHSVEIPSHCICYTFLEVGEMQHEGGLDHLDSCSLDLTGFQHMLPNLSMVPRMCEGIRTY